MAFAVCTLLFATCTATISQPSSSPSLHPSPRWAEVGLRNARQFEAAKAAMFATWSPTSKTNQAIAALHGQARVEANVLLRFYAEQMACSGDVADRQYGAGHGYDLKKAHPAECFDHDTRMYQHGGAMSNNNEEVFIDPDSGGNVIAVIATFDAVLNGGLVKGIRNVYRYTYDQRGVCISWEASYDPVLTVSLMSTYTSWCFKAAERSGHSGIGKPVLFLAVLAVFAAACFAIYTCLLREPLRQPPATNAELIPLRPTYSYIHMKTTHT